MDEPHIARARVKLSLAIVAVSSQGIHLPSEFDRVNEQILGVPQIPSVFINFVINTSLARDVRR